MSHIGYLRYQQRLAAQPSRTHKKENQHMSEFVSAAPPSGGITWEEHLGKLLIVEPLSVETGIQTTFGSADAVKANVHVLTGPNAAEEFPDCLIFPKVLQSQLRTQIGKKVVGRLGQGAAKPGQSAPWLLLEATTEDIDKARGYLEKPITTATAPF